MDREYSFGRRCVAFFFVMGETALFLPFKNAESGNFTAFILALALAIPFYVFWYYLADKMFEIKGRKVIVYIFCLVVILGSVFTSAVTSRGITAYVKEEILIKNSKFLILVFFLGVALYALRCGKKVITKYSVLTFWFCLGITVILFIVSFKIFRRSYFIDAVKGEISSLFPQTFYLFVKCFFSVGVLAVFQRFAFREVGVKNDIRGIVLGGGLLCLCFLSGVLTFSLKTASEMNFSYAQSIGVISVGKLYTRMDGFAYFIFFFSCLIKTAVCAITTQMMFVKMGCKTPKAKAGLLLCISALSGYII